MEFRKKPIVIKAFKWTGDKEQPEEPQWIIDAIRNFDVHFKNIGTEQVVMIIKTLEGDMTASRGDYVIQGIAGEIYPCKPDIFEKTYDIVKSNVMTFGLAIEVLKKGFKVARTGWNGKGMFIYYVPEQFYPSTTDIAKEEFGDMVFYNPYFAIKNVNGSASTWVPSVNDCLAEDWQIAT